MNCTDFLAKLTDFFDGSIAGDLLTEVKKHLGECHHCKVVVNTTQKTIDVYKDHEVYDFPESLSTRLRAAVMQRCKETGINANTCEHEPSAEATTASTTQPSHLQ